MTHAKKIYSLYYRSISSAKLYEKVFSNVSALTAYIYSYLGNPKDYILSNVGSNYCSYSITLESKKFGLIRFIDVYVISGR